MSKPAAFVLGYTGASGKALVQELAKDDYFGRVVLVGRREAELEIENDGRFEQKVVEFDHIENYGEVFQGCDVGFCCIGSSVYRNGKADYAKVDRDYVINTAKVAKETGCKHFILMTTVGADRRSMFYALKIKGQTEDGVRQLGFEKYSIFRPGLLISKRARGETRFYEGFYRRLLIPVKWVFPTRFSIPVETMARGMLNNAKYMTSAEEIYDTHGFYKLAEYKEKLDANKEKQAENKEKQAENKEKLAENKEKLDVNKEKLAENKEKQVESKEKLDENEEKLVENRE